MYWKLLMMKMMIDMSFFSFSQKNRIICLKVLFLISWLTQLKSWLFLKLLSGVGTGYQNVTSWCTKQFPQNIFMESFNLNLKKTFLYHLHKLHNKMGLTTCTVMSFDPFFPHLAGKNSQKRKKQVQIHQVADFLLT